MAAYISLWVGLFYGLQQFVYVFPNIFSFNEVSHTAQRSIVVGIWLAFLAGFSLCGWTVGRFHRTHGIALVLPFAALAGLAAIYRSRHPEPAADLHPETGPHHVDSGGHHRRWLLVNRDRGTTCMTLLWRTP